MPDIVCISPVDGREVVRRAASSAAEIEAAVAAARKAQAEWKRVAVAERGKILSQGRRRDAGDARRGRRRSSPGRWAARCAMAAANSAASRNARAR